MITTQFVLRLLHMTLTEEPLYTSCKTVKCPDQPRCPYLRCSTLASCRYNEVNFSSLVYSSRPFLSSFRSRKEPAHRMQTRSLLPFSIKIALGTRLWFPLAGFPCFPEECATEQKIVPESISSNIILKNA